MLPIPLHRSTLHQLNSMGISPEEVLVCQWVGDGLSGRTVSLLKQCPGIYHQISHRANAPEIEPKNCCINLTKYTLGISKEEGEVFYSNYIFNQIPSFNLSNLTHIAIKTIHKWTQPSTEVSLLQKQDKSLIWRITSGKVHTLIESHFKIICLFPIANPNYSFNAEWIRPSGDRLDLESSVQVPWMLEKVTQNPSFLRDHSIKSISEQHQVTVLEFSADYPKVLSKFDRDLFITPYEWGITLVSVGTDKTNSLPEHLHLDIGDGHSAIVIEMMIDGKYYAKRLELLRWSYPSDRPPGIEHHHGIDYGRNAGNISLKKAWASTTVPDPNDIGSFMKKRVFIEDEHIENVNMLFLHKSPTWIRRKENVQNMLRQVEELYALQERSQSPVFYFHDTGNNYTVQNNFLTSLFLGGVAVASGVVKELPLPYLLAGAGYVYCSLANRHHIQVEPNKTPSPPNGENISPRRYKDWAFDVQAHSEHNFNRHNCASFALKMLEQADITIDQGSLKRHLAQLPKDYASSSIETLNLRPIGFPIWERRIGAQKEVAVSAVNETLIGLPLVRGGRAIKRRNLFIEDGALLGRAKEEFVRFIDEQFLIPANRKIVKDMAYESLSRGLKWGELYRVELDKQEVVNFVYPLMDFLLESQGISRKLLGILCTNNIHIPKKTEENWKDKEECLISPKTYEETLQALISNLLKLEVCNKILWSFKFSRPEEQGGSFTHLIKPASYLKVI